MAWYDGAVVRFYDHVDDKLLKFAVIIAQTEGKWVFCKHNERDTYELPGGHREAGETVMEAAKRELYEETGALTYSLMPVCVYSVSAPDNFNGEESSGCSFMRRSRSSKTSFTARSRALSSLIGLLTTGPIRLSIRN